METREYRILIVTPENRIALKLKEALELKRWTVVVAPTYNDGLFLFRESQIDLVITDSQLDKGESLDFLKEIRTISPIPIVVVTNQETSRTVITAFSMGADDVIEQPYHYEEAVCRVERLFKYYYQNSPFYEATGTFISPDLSVDFAQETVMVLNKRVELTHLEYKVLIYLIHHKEDVVTREELLEKVWGYDKFGSNRTVDNLIQKLRKKLAVYSQEAAGYIRTEWRKGYRFKVPN